MATHSSILPGEFLAQRSPESYSHGTRQWLSLSIETEKHLMKSMPTKIKKNNSDNKL